MPHAPRLRLDRLKVTGCASSPACCACARSLQGFRRRRIVLASSLRSCSSVLTSSPACSFYRPPTSAGLKVRVQDAGGSSLSLLAAASSSAKRRRRAGTLLGGDASPGARSSTSGPVTCQRRPSHHTAESRAVPVRGWAFTGVVLSAGVGARSRRGRDRGGALPRFRGVGPGSFGVRFSPAAPEGTKAGVVEGDGAE